MRMWIDSPPSKTGTVIECGPLVAPGAIAPHDWFEAGLAPGAARDHDELAEPAQTRDGWAMRLFVLRAGDDEVRIGAVYVVPPWRGLVLARIPAAHVDAEQARVIELLAGARPDLWANEPACVAELWSDAVT